MDGIKLDQLASAAAAHAYAVALSAGNMYMHVQLQSFAGCGVVGGQY